MMLTGGCQSALKKLCKRAKRNALFTRCANACPSALRIFAFAAKLLIIIGLDTKIGKGYLVHIPKFQKNRRKNRRGITHALGFRASDWRLLKQKN
jgi:hypothetical protein